jgi:hypothetical protein
MKFLIFVGVLFLFLFSFVNGAYPEDYSFSINHDDAIWSWIERDGATGYNLYPVSGSSYVNFGTLYTHLLEGYVEFDFNDVSTENFIFSAGPLNWYPAIENVNFDTDPSTTLDARIRLRFLDSFGAPLQFTDQYSDPSNPDIRYISAGCSNLVLNYPLTSIYFDNENFDESCEFVIENPAFRSQLNSFRLNYDFDLAIRASERPYFHPVIEGPIISYLVEDCLSPPSLDEDRDGYWGCLDPDCNGQIPRGPVSPSECIEDHYTYSIWNAYTWDGLSWINSEQYGCTGSSGVIGYCCPLWWNWDSGSSTCVPPVASGICGDNTIDMPNLLGLIETCDGTDLSGLDCTDFSFTNSAGLLCLFDCTDFDTSFCTGALVGSCGNGIIESGEECEWSGGVQDLNGKNCESELGSGFGGSLNCYSVGDPSECTFNTSSCIASVISPPPVTGPDEYIVYNECADDGDGNQYGITNWTLYSGDGTELNTSTSLCVLYGSNAPFLGFYGILLFFIVLFGFYYREKYLNGDRNLIV